MFENLVNFRDLGGTATADGALVRPATLYRSESVAYLTEPETVRLVDEFGLATVVDLRGEKEVARLGRGPLAGRPVRYLHVPITDVTRGMDGMADFYFGVLDRRGDAVAGIVRAMLTPGALPAVVHCEAGCDRTGIVVATLLGLVGVPDPAIVADYDLTRAAFPAMNARWKRMFVDRGNAPEKFVEETWVERATAMARAIAMMRDRWGDWVGWATAYGLTDAELGRLRTTLTTGGSNSSAESPPG